MIGELVQSFYGKKGVYLKQIATKGIFTGLGNTPKTGLIIND